MLSMNPEQKAKLMDDLRMVIDDAQEMLRMTADQVSESAAGVRARLQARLAKATEEFHHLQDAATARANAAGHATDGFVRENPWKAVGIAAGVGLLVGLLMARR